MAFRRSRLFLAAAGFAFAILLQGCGQEHINSFLELSCRSAAEHAIDLTESEWVQKLADECESLFQHGSSGEQACFDEGSGVVEEDREAVLKNYTETCVNTLSNLTESEGFMSLRTAIEDLMDSLSPNGTLGQMLETHLNTTFEEVRDEFMQDLIGDHGSDSDNASSADNHADPASEEAHHESSDSEHESQHHGSHAHHESSDSEHESHHHGGHAHHDNHSEHESQHHGSHDTRLFNADIRKARLARAGRTRFALIACATGTIALAAVLGFVVLRRRIRSSSPAYVEQGQTILLEEGEQSEQ